MSRSQFKPSSNNYKKKPSSHSGTGDVRIISGRWRGRKLAVPSVEGLRPTPDRIRETLFNWLASSIYQSQCLDLYCGSGALGFEAASRGAAAVILVDLNNTVAEQINLNIEQLTVENINFMKRDVIEFLNQPGKSMDVVFIDPPFNKGMAEIAMQSLETNNWLKPEAKIYVETEIELENLSAPENWSLLKEKKAGQVRYRLYGNG